MATKQISAAELSKHNKPGDYWLAIEGDVYDVSTFIEAHPGGEVVIRQLAGNDVTDEFFELHRRDVLTKYPNLIIGRLDSAKAKVDTTGSLSKVPFAEIPAMAGQFSPYYNDTHRAFLQGARKFVQKELVPMSAAKDLEGSYPERETLSKIGMAGMYAARLGPGPWMKELTELGITLPGGVKPEEFDYFHEMIAHQEMNRLGLPGFIDSLGAGYMISVPAIFHFGTEKMIHEVGRPLLKGDISSALAISEPFAGSDVASIRTTAELTPDGKHFIVNGVKKWITEGCYSEYFVTAVRTGGAGARGISMLLIPRDCEEGEIETSQIKTTYSTCCGTALVTFDNVKVPVENILGKENDGFKLIMYNFNHERWMIVNQLVGQARACLTDTFMWANQRSVFGKRLIDQPVIKYKLSAAIASMEAVQALNEALTFDMMRAEGGPVGQRMAGSIAMLKFQSTRMGWAVADDAVQIMGGRGITRTGMGAKVEGFKNYVKYAAVYGGSEEIMADLAIKQALKNYPADAKL